MINLANNTILCDSCLKENTWRHYFDNLDESEEFSRCSCGGNLFLIDSLASPILKKLWKKGYTTHTSCFGHHDLNFSPYILFAKNYDIPTPPNAVKDENPTAIRFDYGGQIKPKDLKNLLFWANGLPPILMPYVIKKAHQPYKKREFVKKEAPIVFLGKNSFELNKDRFQGYNAIPTEKFHHTKIDNKTIIVFPLNEEKENNLIPSPISGWGIFGNKPLPLFDIFKASLRLNPIVYTGDKDSIYRIF